jgi:hypothetical protein
LGRWVLHVIWERRCWSIEIYTAGARVIVIVVYQHASRAAHSSNAWLEHDHALAYAQSQPHGMSGLQGTNLQMYGVHIHFISGSNEGCLLGCLQNAGLCKALLVDVHSPGPMMQPACSLFGACFVGAFPATTVCNARHRPAGRVIK